MNIKEVKDLISEINFYEQKGKFALADSLTEKLVKLSYEAQVGDLTRAGRDHDGSELAKRTISMNVINSLIRTIPECNAIQGGIFAAGNVQERAMAKANQENIEYLDAFNKVIAEDQANDPTKATDPNYMACMNALQAKRMEIQGGQNGQAGVAQPTQSVQVV